MKTLAPFLWAPWVVHDKMCNAHSKGCTQMSNLVYVRHLCVLENRDISECYTGKNPFKASIHTSQLYPGLKGKTYLDK